MKDLVSIIMPAYNAEKKIEFAISSVVNQTYSDWELIIINDGSKDKSLEITSSYSSKDKRIVLMSLEENHGISNARNIGIKKAKGRYLAFLDSDDIWHPSKLEKQISFMRCNGYVFTYTNYEVIDYDGNKINKIIRVPEKVDYKSLLKGNSIPCLTVMLEKDMLPDIHMPDIKHEDYATWLNLLRTGIVAHGLNETLAEYRKSNNSVSANKFTASTWTWKIYRENEKLGLPKSIYYFLCYIINALKKHFVY